MPAYNYTTLDDPLQTDFMTQANGINNAGQIVGQYHNSSGYHGFLYSAGTYTPIDDPLATISTVAYDINDAGEIVGFYASNATHGFLYDPTKSVNPFTTLDFPGANTTTPTKINASGQVVGLIFDSVGSGEHGFLYRDHLFSAIDAPQATTGTAVGGINASGQIVGSYHTATETNGFLFNPSTGSYTPLIDPVARFTFAEDINDAGQIVGSFREANGHEHGFLYSGGTYTTFDVPNSTLTHAFGINNAGQIVGRYTNASGQHGFLLTITPNPPPPTGTTADMILRASNSSLSAGQYEIYDIGNNSLLAANQLGQVGTDWQFVTLGGFFGSDTTDMLLRNGNTGGVEVYDISNNRLTGANFMGTVGLNWQFSGVGNFSSQGESDMLLRNSNNGGLEVYDIANNQITNAAFIGTIGVDWQFSGVGNFSGMPGETDLLLRNSRTGALEVYDIANNQLTGAAFIGTVGLDWQFAGIAPIHAAGASDLVLRNVTTGAFEVYDIAGNQLVGAASLGQVGLDWQLGGYAADPPTLPGAFADVSNDQLVQAMAGLGGGSGEADGLNVVADTAQQQLLTMPLQG
jgi:probable HAF family extracellular repeat protein